MLHTLAELLGMGMCAFTWVGMNVSGFVIQSEVQLTFTYFEEHFRSKFTSCFKMLDNIARVDLMSWMIAVCLH